MRRRRWGKRDASMSRRMRKILEPPAPSAVELEPGTYARITVSDAGPGFGEDVAKRLFEPFFTTRPAGTGLGLPTVRKIVRDHDGAVDVASAPGKGSRFEVWLPAAKTDAPTTARANPVAPPGSAKAKPCSSFTTTATA